MGGLTTPLVGPLRSVLATSSGTPRGARNLGTRGVEVDGIEMVVRSGQRECTGILFPVYVPRLLDCPTSGVKGTRNVRSG